MANETEKMYEIRRSRGDFETYLNGRGLDIGCGPCPLRVDKGHVDAWDKPQGDGALLEGVPTGLYDFVYSSHSLEHMKSIRQAIKNWSRVLKQGGYLYITVSDWEIYEKRTWPSMFNQDHKHTFSLDYTRTDVGRKNHWHVDDIREVLVQNGLSLLEIGVEEHGYDWSRPEVDQTMEEAVCQINIIAVKTAPAPTKSLYAYTDIMEVCKASLWAADMRFIPNPPERTEPRQVRKPDLGTKVILARPGRAHLGDCLCTSSLPRLLAGQGKEIRYRYQKTMEQVLENNPYVEGSTTQRGVPTTLRPYNRRYDCPGSHFIQILHKRFGLQMPPTLAGEVYLSEQEKEPIVEGPYLLLCPDIVSGNNKGYADYPWQGWIDALSHHFKIVQPICGKKQYAEQAALTSKQRSHWNEPIEYRGTQKLYDLSLRQFLSLFYCAEGYIGTHAGGMHAAQAFGVPSIIIGHRDEWVHKGNILLGNHGKWVYPGQLAATKRASK